MTGDHTPDGRYFAAIDRHILFADVEVMAHTGWLGLRVGAVIGDLIDQLVWSHPGALDLTTLTVTTTHNPGTLYLDIRVAARTKEPTP